MSATTALKNAYLDGVTWSAVSFHTDFPGSTGANEVTGGSYARMTPVMNAASGGVRSLNASINSPVPACTVKWLGWWGPTSTYYESVPNGGATPKNFVGQASSDLVYLPGHGYSDTQKIVFYGGTPPGGLTEGTTYFVRDSATDTFKVAATSGGSAIDISSSAPFACVVCAITEEVYASPGTHTLSTATKTFPA